MAEESPHRTKQSAFGKKLRESLAVGGGINDDNLLGKLDAELRTCFGIALDESDVIVARERIADKLNPLIGSLTKGVKECLPETYRDIVRVSFNLYYEPDFGSRTLLQRWKLYAAQNGGYPSSRTASRILDDAIIQIEQHLRPYGPEPEQKPKPKTRWRVPVGIVTALVVVLVLMSLPKQKPPAAQDGNLSGDPPSSTPPASQATSSSTVPAGNQETVIVKGDSDQSLLPYMVGVETDPDKALAGLEKYPARPGREPFLDLKPQYVFPTGKLQMLKPPDERSCDDWIDDWTAWGRSNGGTDKYATVASFAVTAKTDQPVHVQGSLIRKELPNPGGDVPVCFGGGGTPGQYYLEIRLDDNNMCFREGNNHTEQSKCVPFKIDVEKGRSENTLIGAISQKGYWAWRIELDITVGSQRFIHHIDNHGKDFITAPGEGPYQQYTYDFTGRGWERYP